MIFTRKINNLILNINFLLNYVYILKIYAELPHEFLYLHTFGYLFYKHLIHVHMLKIDILIMYEIMIFSII